MQRSPFILAVLVLYVLACFFAFMWLYRAGWVRRQRLRILDSARRVHPGACWHNPLDAYQGFQAMMWKMWIWDVEKFRIRRSRVDSSKL